jgi:thimet oligopeptidase
LADDLETVWLGGVDGAELGEPGEASYNASYTVERPWTLRDAAGLEAWVAEALARHQAALDALLAETGERTLENTLRRYDDAVAELSTAGSLLNLLDSVHPEKAIRDTAQVQIQKVSQAGVALGLNQGVYRALSEMSLDGLAGKEGAPQEGGPGNAASENAADAATRHYVERTLLGYRLAGVDRDEITRKRLAELQEKATLLSLTFGRAVQEGGKQVVVEDASELAGLPADFLASHQAAVEGEFVGKIVLTTEFPDYLPVMTFAENAALRRRMMLAYNTRAYPGNKQVLLDLLAVRREIANLLGFETWADYATADQMMESSAKMQGFLDELEVATREGAAREYASVLAFAQEHCKRAGEPYPEAIDGSSRGYWLELYRRSAYAFDSQSVRPYFAYERSERGVLALVERLFRVRFEAVLDAEVWHDSVKTFDVYDALAGTAGRRLGRFYLDMHPREGKDKWFSAHPLVPGIAGRQVPEAALICNFPEESEGDPGLMQHSDVVTYLHEFGHLMHAILGGQQRWAGISGIATEGDFVEVPSQMLEEFFRDPVLLAGFALHYETGEQIPAELVERMNRAGAFGRADSVRTQLFYTSYSLDTHRLDPASLDLDALLVEDYQRFLPYTWVEGNRLYASFGHLCGYSSNYYTYLYDKVIALDFFNLFPRADLLDETVASRYRETVLAAGGSRPGKQIVEEFLSRAQSAEAFTRWVGEAQEAGDAVLAV